MCVCEHMSVTTTINIRYARIVFMVFLEVQGPLSVSVSVSVPTSFSLSWCFLAEESVSQTDKEKERWS